MASRVVLVRALLLIQFHSPEMPTRLDSCFLAATWR